jgi:hypothetical protein
MAEGNSSTIDDRGGANVFDPFGSNGHEVHSGGTYRSTDVFNHGELPVDTSDSTISPDFDLRPRSYASASLGNGTSRLRTANEDF